MRLWTMQPVEILDIIEKEGVFRCNPELSEYGTDFSDAYSWLIQKMDEKIPRPEGCVLPVWAWHTRYWKHKKPDLRNIGLGMKGEKSVCIEIEIPDEEVLLSDFDEWHFVLNDSWIDDSNCEEEWEKMHDEFDALPFSEQERLKKESWNKIFDITPFENDWRRNGEFVQATFWEIKKENVKKVQFFTAR